MNHNELLKELEKRMSRYGYCDTWTHIELFIKEYEAVTKDEKPIRLKDVIKRIKEFDKGTKFKWTYDILKELGSDFASKVFHEGYQQGRFDEAVETHHEPQKIKVPQFVADWYEENKDVFEANLYRCAYNIPSVFDGAKLNEFERWFLTAGTKPFQTLVNMHQFGYEVEKEKRYRVKMKGTKQYLHKDTPGPRFSSMFVSDFTRNDIEDLGFGWVFDCEGIEIEEVAE